jgi:hypothetical protein
MAAGRVARTDYEYVRCGTANVFCILEPKAGCHHTHTTPNRKAPQFASIHWRFTTADARRVFAYLPITTHESKH